MNGFARVNFSAQRGTIAGKVVDALTTTPVVDAVAVIEKGPDAFEQWLALQAQQSLAHPANQTTTAEDGFFGFIDLPDGDYTIAVQGPAFLHYGIVRQSFTVNNASPTNSVTLVSLSPTGATGTVQNRDTLTSLPLARVRVDGRTEVVYCDKNGRFVVSGVFPGECRLYVSAIKFRRRAVTATMAIGNIIDLGTILLEPTGA